MLAVKELSAVLKLDRLLTRYRATHSHHCGAGGLRFLCLFVANSAARCGRQHIERVQA